MRVNDSQIQVLKHNGRNRSERVQMEELYKRLTLGFVERNLLVFRDDFTSLNIIILLTNIH